MKANLIIHNGKIHTLDPEKPTAEAAVVKDGRFVAVGRDRALMPFRSDHQIQIIDLKGRTVMPGLNDSHLHLIRCGLSLTWNCAGKGCLLWPRLSGC